MKRLFTMLVVISSLLVFNLGIKAEETVAYAFDSITITSAFKYDVGITEAPNEQSFLYNYVEAGESVTIYVGRLQFEYDGEIDEDASSIIIVTNESGEDIIKWVINGASFRDVGNTYEFSSHITIDPLYGVIKSLKEPPASATVFVGEDNECRLTDNTDEVYTMIPGTFSREDGLNIVISAYEPDYERGE